MIPFTDRSVECVFEQYPIEVRSKMFALRDLVFTTAERAGVSPSLVESLKWGEPAYQCREGSTLRMHWKENDPDSYRLFFHCGTSLVSTFREVYKCNFTFEGNRAIRFSTCEEPDLSLVGRCIEVSLLYHRVKKLPLLGLSACPGES